MTITVIYGTESGATKTVAKKIAAKLQAKLVNVAAASPADFEDCDLLVLGTPTYGMGEMPPDWESGIGLLDEANLSGKKVALFGTGDQLTYPDTFVDAMGILFDKVAEKGAQVVGHTETVGYDFSDSLALRDGKFVGLALDEDGQPEKTDNRIADWIGRLS